MTHHWKVGPVMIVINRVRIWGPYKLTEKFSRVNLGFRVLYQSGVITYSIYKGAHLLHIDISFDKRSLIFDKPITGWWQLKYFLCSPQKLGKMNPF